eukprot:365263-Chlamydomonas_euryale.AAC.4
MRFASVAHAPLGDRSTARPNAPSSPQRPRTPPCTRGPRTSAAVPSALGSDMKASVKRRRNGGGMNRNSWLPQPAQRNGRTRWRCCACCSIWELRESSIEQFEPGAEIHTCCSGPALTLSGDTLRRCSHAPTN